MAPLFNGSFFALLKKVAETEQYAMNDEDALSTIATSDLLMRITRRLKESKFGVGLNGIFMPALEDFELAQEYEAGRFSIERNIFVSLHSGLGIDTYPIGVDESRQRVVDILRCVQGLSNKYNKSLSVRFVSDGKVCFS